MGIEFLREGFRYTEWADAGVWRGVVGCPEAAGDREIRDRLLHIHLVQRAFLSVWKGEQVQFPKLEDFGELGGIRDWGRPFYAEIGAFLSVADEATLGRRIRMPWAKEFELANGTRFEDPTLAETAFQLINHTTHHRGQVTARLRALGGAPPLVDYIGWIWFGRPAPPWD